MKITPKSHQREVVDRLVGECVNQHGMLVAHKMGGGKTLTALMFMNNFPKHKKIIVAPKYLLNVWQADSKKLMGRPLPSDVSLLSYQDFMSKLEDNLNFVKNKIIVFDEVQYLEESFWQFQDWSKQKKATKLVQSSTYRVLLLTGTPVRTGLKDIAYYVNIAAGKDIMPKNFRTFYDTYGIANKRNIVLYGYITPIVQEIPAIFTNLQSTIYNFFMYSGSFFLIKYALSKMGYDLSKSFLMQGVTKFQSSMINKILNMMNTIGNFTLFDTIKDYAVPRVKGAFNLDDDDMKALEIMLKLLGAIGVFGFVMKQVYGSAKHDLFLYKRIDYDKFGEDIKPYVSFFDLVEGENGVPSQTETNEFIIYSDFQYDLWNKFIYNNLSVDDTKLLGSFHSDEEEYENDEEQLYISDWHFIRYGRIISNIEKGLYPEKFHVMFGNIEKHFKNPKNNHKYVIHSEFNQTIKLLKKFLEEKQQDFEFTFVHIKTSDSPETIQSVLEDYYSNKINIVILDPGFYEGISLLKTSQMHILDPPLEYSQYAQLKGRVVRMQSHEGLPKHQRTVQYFNYIGMLPADAFSEFNTIEKVKRAVEVVEKTTKFKAKGIVKFFESWIKTHHYKEEIFLKFSPEIGETMTPEFITFKKTMNLQKQSQEFDKTLNKLKKTKTSLESKMVCCPTYIEGPDPECLVNLPQCGSKPAKRKTTRLPKQFS